MRQLIPPGRYMRLILWAGQHKGRFVAYHGIGATLVGLLCFGYLGVIGYGPSLIILIVITSFVMGALIGWFFWHLFVWPPYAAYPGSPELPPHIKVFDDAHHKSVGKKTDVA